MTDVINDKLKACIKVHKEVATWRPSSWEPRSLVDEACVIMAHAGEMKFRRSWAGVQVAAEARLLIERIKAEVADEW